ncbi:haloacid dehalogenase type II [Thermodesulfatator indicus]
MSANFEWVTFDCYGTLIDWETGILKALKPIFALEDAEILKLYARFESEAERTWKPYREILKEVALKFFDHFGLKPDPGQENILWQSLPSWPPFPEVKEALAGLKKAGFKFAIISNIDNDLLAKSVAQMGVSFDALITAEEARSYKPGQAIFELAETRLSVSPERIFHVAQSLFHDIAPAKERGWTTCWVKRPSRDPFGATPPAEARPDFVISELREVIKIIG